MMGHNEHRQKMKSRGVVSLCSVSPGSNKAWKKSIILFFFMCKTNQTYLNSLCCPFCMSWCEEAQNWQVSARFCDAAADPVGCNNCSVWRSDPEAPPEQFKTDSMHRWTLHVKLVIVRMMWKAAVLFCIAERNHLWINLMKIFRHSHRGKNHWFL